MQHVPVLAEDVLRGLNLSPGASVIDATVGLGGHASLMLREIGNKGTLYAFDRDERNLKEAKKTLGKGKNVVYIRDSFAHLADHDLPAVNAVLFDLGFSSVHVDDASRGFSFQHEGPLDMRYDQTQELTAEAIVNGWSRDDLAKILRQLGEEPQAARIAKAIFDARRKERITTTIGLADIIESAVPRRSRLHPATRTFQALRMVVNDELGQIEEGLSSAVALLKDHGRIAVISFHSLEDRLVKRFLNGRDDLRVITKKPITASYQETKENPRARSAKLRLAEKYL